MARRRNHEEEHENHERWLVSYADFITLLFAFFVVMYALSSINEGKYRILSDSLVAAFRSVSLNTSGAQIAVPAIIDPQASPSPMGQRTAEQAAADARRQAELARMRSIAEDIRRVLEPLTRGGQVRVSDGVHGITVEINASVLFAPGEAALGAPATTVLRAVAEVLAGADFPITIEGHTDNLPISNFRFPSNWELSAVRASSVVRLFVESGVGAARLTAAGYSDQRPIADNRSEEGRARNRRVTILIESLLGDPPSAGPGTMRADDPVRAILPAAGG